MATMSVLLSTVVSHHHHMDRICMVQEQCQEDGNINDEHTDHHDQESNTDRGNCRVHQMHHFVTNAKVVKGIRKLLVDESHQFVVLSCSSLLILPRLSLISVRWQHVAASPLAEELAAGYSRRGPPSFLRFYSSLPLGCKNRFEDSNATELQGFLCTFASGFMIRSVV